MAITNINNTNNAQQETPFMAEAVYAVENMDAGHTEEKQHNIKNLLDQLFPLTKGSHQEVTNYLLDYHHLVVFLKMAVAAVCVTLGSLWHLQVIVLLQTPFF